MSRFPDDDQPLTRFLKQHQPMVPVAHPDLEDQLMRAIASTPQPRLAVVSSGAGSTTDLVGSPLRDRSGVSGNGRQPSYLCSSLPAQFC